MIPEHVLEGMDVLKENHYPVFTTNTSYEHILKVFPTQIIHGKHIVDTYQYTSDSGMGVSDEDYPEATFSFDFNPLTIVISDVKKPFYHFITLVDSLFNRAEIIYKEKEILGKTE